MATNVQPGSTKAVSQLYRTALVAAWAGLAINLALAVVKILAGIFGHSIALTADAINSSGDALTSGVVVYALRVSQRPPDREHPYGHSRAEAIAALGVGILIGVSALAIAVEALRSLSAVHPITPAWTLWIAAGNVVVKEAMFRYKRGVAARTGSQALVAGAWDHRCDAMGSAAVLVGLAVVRYGGERVIWADEVAALVVVGFILIASVKLLRSSASQLMDEQCTGDILESIGRVAGETPGVERVEKIRARRSGLEVFVDIHIEVDGALSVSEGHRIAHDVQDRLVERITPLSEALVHVEPAKRHSR